MFKLVIQDDEGKTTVVPLIRDEITIGRKEGNTIRLTERNVSRRHARILRNNGEVQIEDLGSYNGIRVNNARIAERVSLRVSDQVQIGDYKLYLKAEGVEQIDDGTTRPVERIDNAPTDVMNVPTVPNVAGVATQPIAVPPAPAPAPASFIGVPGRTQVSLDPEPQRPVVSPKENPLTAPVGYGKLVVLSSNFAGKEFELSRPQMIIGRTDDNDIVVNHRSISRNHAKLTREPESGRYTISDLQSSNGVRVNGQDYGKVELRRGDVIDLGHVRLRFVEPGEDFVFSRDAVITDVPDSGSRRGLMIAIILSVIVIAGIAAFVMMKTGGGEKKPEGSGSGGSGSSGSSGSGNVVGSGSGSDDTTPIDAPELVTNTTPDAAIDAPPATSNPAAKDIEVQCLGFQNDQKWPDLDGCADKLKPLNAAMAAEFKTRAVNEIKSRPRIDAADNALRDKNLKKAKQELDQVWPGSVSYKRLKDKYDAAEATAINELVSKLNRVNSGECSQYTALLAQERSAKPSRVAAEAQKQVRCTPTATQPPPACGDIEALLEKGRNQYAEGAYSQALTTFETALTCRPGESSIIQRAFVSSCNMGNRPKAKLYWKKLTKEARVSVNQACVRNGITVDQLEEP